MTGTESLRAAEERFQAAQLASDVGELDLFLHHGLVFVGPDGALEQEDLIVRVSSGVGVTILTARMAGEFASQGFSARMRYTRSGAWGGARGGRSLPPTSA